jgi:uncharacterized protein (DUF2342 family)
MTQTAVEWLVEQLFKTNNNTNDVKKIDSKSIIEQAKEMEKEQIIDACESTSNTNFWVKYESFEQYYNETFKNK